MSDLGTVVPIAIHNDSVARIAVYRASFNGNTGDWNAFDWNIPSDLSLVYLRKVIVIQLNAATRVAADWDTRRGTIGITREGVDLLALIPANEFFNYNNALNTDQDGVTISIWSNPIPFRLRANDSIRVIHPPGDSNGTPTEDYILTVVYDVIQYA